MGTVWVLLLGRHGYRIENEINGFDYVGTFSTLGMAQQAIREQEKPIHLLWDRFTDRFEGEYWLAEYRRVWDANSQRAAIAIKASVDYQITEVS